MMGRSGGQITAPFQGLPLIGDRFPGLRPGLPYGRPCGPANVRCCLGLRNQFEEHRHVPNSLQRAHSFCLQHQAQADVAEGQACPGRDVRHHGEDSPGLRLSPDSDQWRGGPRPRSLRLHPQLHDQEGRERAKDGSFQMDQDPRCGLSGLSVAKRVRGVFGEPIQEAGAG